MTIDSDDEFYGNQSSSYESSPVSISTGVDAADATPKSDHPFGNVAAHEYRSHERTVQTLSYLDGYDETKEAKLQEGFSRGYRRSFDDAFRIGRSLGSLCAKAALGESSTLATTNDASDATGRNSEYDRTKNVIEGPASLVREFLRDEILIGRIEDTKKRDEALLILEDQLCQASI
jgi:hypothetical protein